MRRVPGVVFADSADGRRALVAGTGIKVWLIIDTFVRLGEDFEALKTHYDWLSDVQLRAAVTYWRTYPEEIDKELNVDEEAFVQDMYEQYPFMKPPHLT